MQDPIFVQLAEVFSQLDIHANVFSGDRAPILDLASPDQISGATSIVPESFATLEQAERTMTILQNWTLRHLVTYVEYKQGVASEVPLHVKRERLHSEAELRKFEHAIQTIGFRPDKQLSEEQQERVMLLQTQALILHGVVLENSLYDLDGVDSPINASNVFDRALEKAACLLSSSKPTAGAGFTLSTNIIAMLYLICMKTTDRKILQEALSLMQGSLFAARDGLWDVNDAVLMVQAMLPEDGLESSNDSELAIKLEDVGAGIVDATGGFDDAIRTLQGAQRAFSESTSPGAMP